MIRLLIFGLFALLILSVLYFLKGFFGKKATFGLISLFLLLFTGVIFYDYTSSQYELKKELFLKNFFDKKTQKCKGFELNSKDFNYNWATESFILKTKINTIIDIKSCINE